MPEQRPLVTDAPLIMHNTLVIKPEQRGPYLAALLAVLPQARALPGCLLLEAGESVDTPGTIHLFERWRSGTEYLERYLQLPFYQEYLATTEEMYAAPRQVSVLADMPAAPEAG